MVKPRRVATLFGTERQYFRGVLLGIARFARLHGAWELEAEPTYQGGQISARQIRDSDGAMLFLLNRRELLSARRWKIPIINMGSLFPAENFGHVSNDGAALARMAIEHFIERGFHHFAYCELDHHSFHRSRRFEEQLAARNLTAHMFRVSKSQHNDWIHGHDRARLEDWLRELPKPVAILSHNDIRGRHVAEACRRLHLGVPDEVAILGIDNELPHCEMCIPPLSSIVTDAERIGFEAAALLDQLMDGEKPENLRILIPPLGIVTRQSTDVTATTDQLVAEAVRYIREQACSGIDVGDVLKHIVVSRTALDNRFVAALGHTPHEELLRVRLKRACDLLTETNLTVEIVAERSGFRHGEYLGAVFQREFGQTPGQFRAQHQQSRKPKELPNGRRTSR